MSILPYNRSLAIAYAHQWALGRNPRYYDYELLGGDCTNFASQCLYAGAGVMDFTPTFGWYYRNANSKAPAWTGVQYFYNYITNGKRRPGPFGTEVFSLEELEPGDFVQLDFRGGTYSHTPIIVSMGSPPTLANTLIASHSFDSDYRPLDSYTIKKMRFLHIRGVYQ